ncbi:MAG TPA: DinB family protein [Planctomycetota bacterium]|nr:DinB family protein [Planctomycetota bacterium]
MRMNTSLAQRNAAFLEQALELLDSLAPEVYAARPAHFERGGVGVHLRHVLDHYDAFLDGLDSGCIDYDARQRDPATEADLSVARERLCATIARMGAILARPENPRCSPGRDIEVAMDLGGLSGTRSNASVSSVGRELQYLVAHTVHHFALMAVALRLAGHEPSPEFGVAPSTLRHEEANRGACAR